MTIRHSNNELKIVIENLIDITSAAERRDLVTPHKHCLWLKDKLVQAQIDLPYDRRKHLTDRNEYNAYSTTIRKYFVSMNTDDMQVTATTTHPNNNKASFISNCEQRLSEISTILALNSMSSDAKIMAISSIAQS